jgi:membrane-associated protease RseP (regulator of RpoE activity)
MILAAVTACAAFAARAVAALMEGMYLAPAARAGVSSPLPARAAPPPPAPPDGSALIARNMFCSTCTPTVPEPTAGFAPDATLVATSVGFMPIATLRTNTVSGNFGVGDVVPGVGTIAKIGFTYVELVDSDGRHGRVTLEGSGDAGRAATPPAAAAEADPWEGRLTKIDDHTFEVERSLVRELVSGQVKAGSARVIPIPGPNGQLAGLRMTGVRTGSLAGALGLKNADTLTEINGTKITNANVLLDVLAKLDTLDVVEVDGTRGGKPLGITLRLK